MVYIGVNSPSDLNHWSYFQRDIQVGANPGRIQLGGSRIPSKPRLRKRVENTKKTHGTCLARQESTNNTSWWLNTTHLKKIGQIGNLPQIVVKKKNETTT